MKTRTHIMTINQYYCRKTSNFGRILEKLIPNSRSYTAITSCRASKFDFFSCSLHCGYFFRSWMCFRVSHICSKILINSLTGTKCPRRLYHSPIYLHLIISDTTSERKARKLVCHSQFCERSSPAVKARAPTSSTTKLWSNHEQTTTFHLSQLFNNPSNPTFAQHFLFQ